ncbi:adenosylhomocysteinase [Thiohalocapsa marina]|uniref:Adenosylhomocysteinase n=1 Tax=Thiohalocapsa marina TaxID=424902 RepID=A0A5M8FFL5_9GAMM|nr:adenosylhomocysteinase [Thiohalocapsa marina]KAA6183673.1 adenosylhomocysteinase [Thiohalocapsa marina]
MTRASGDINDPARAEAGRSRIDWAAAEMPVLAGIRERFARERPLQGLRISGCLHITSETANLARTLRAGGAGLVLCASNPLSTQDDVAASLVVHDGIPVFARRGEDTETYYRHIRAALAHRPRITLDDGADLVSELHKTQRDLLDGMLGGTEETTTGVIRLRAMAAEGALRYPVVAVNDALTKHLFDNRYGTGQSALDGVIRATNSLIAGRVFTVVGYGWCGRGLAMRAKGHGARVVVTEVEPLRALEAVMDGFEVMPLVQAAARSDFIVTVTGDKHVLDRCHFEVMKDGCVIANSGHFNVEINLPALAAMAVRRQRPRESVEEFVLADGRRIRVLAEGRLVNLAAAEGHPAAVMDMSFANQALAVAWLVEHGPQLAAEVHPVPREIDQAVARLKLDALGLQIDRLTPEQSAYLASWGEGT